MKVVIANDHAGVKLKKALKEHLEQKGIEVKNFGTDSEESIDYPDVAKEAASAVQKKKADFGIVICGPGIGVSITANKFKGIRAALCYNVFAAKMSRNHNDANIIALGARTMMEEDALVMVDTFLSEGFSGERHARRVGKVSSIEEDNFREVE